MKKQLESTEKAPDRVVSVHPQLASRRLGEYEKQARAEEFDRLIDSSGCDIVESMAFPLRKPVPATLLGAGQVQQVADSVEASEAAVVFVDHQLTPVQQRNLEKAWSAKVVDRTGLILEIFAARARTREGGLQVELASLNYQVSRLVRSWTHLERQRGGFGFMGGPGERQIELDRRMIRNRIRTIEGDLAKVRRMRHTQRAGRQRNEILTVALVGYTNAGKSTLFNRMTGAGVYAADQLFATLDPTLRTVELPGGGSIVLSDTVGFLQDLPHELVDAFRATLEEVVEADLILHVRDASDPRVREQGDVVMETLAQIGLDGDHAPPIVEVWNKTDVATDVQSRKAETLNGTRVALSALSGQGVDELLELLRDWAEANKSEIEMKFDLADSKSLAYCYAHGRVLSREDTDEYVLLKVRLSPKDRAAFTEENGISKLSLHRGING